MIEYEDLGKLNQPFFEEYRQSFDETLKSGWYILGNQVKKFEANFAGYCGVSYCIGLASGLDALVLAVPHAAYRAMGEARLAALLAPGGIVADVKSVLDRSRLPPGHRYWSL